MWQASEQVKHRAQCSIDMRRGWRNVQLFSGVKSFRMPLKNWLTRRSSSSLDAGFGMFRAIVSSRHSYFFLAWSESGAMTGSSPSLSNGGGSGIWSSMSTWVSGPSPLEKSCKLGSFFISLPPRWRRPPMSFCRPPGCAARPRLWAGPTARGSSPPPSPRGGSAWRSIGGGCEVPDFWVGHPPGGGPPGAEDRQAHACGAAGHDGVLEQCADHAFEQGGRARGEEAVNPHQHRPQGGQVEPEVERERSEPHLRGVLLERDEKHDLGDHRLELPDQGLFARLCPPVGLLEVRAAVVRPARFVGHGVQLPADVHGQPGPHEEAGDDGDGEGG